MADIVRRTYWFAFIVAVGGMIACWVWLGWHGGIGFLLAAAVSIGNFWLQDWMTQSVVPDPGSDIPKKAWPAGIFVLRYLLLIAAAYAIVKALGVNALAVIAGLMTTAAAVLAATFFELVQNLWVKRSSQQ